MNKPAADAAAAQLDTDQQKRAHHEAFEARLMNWSQITYANNQLSQEETVQIKASSQTPAEDRPVTASVPIYVNDTSTGIQHQH